MANTLSHTPSQILRQTLIDLGLASNGGASWPIYATQEVDMPDNSIVVMDRAGLDRGRFMNGGQIQELQGVEVRVRALDPTTAHVKADEIKTELTESIHLETVTVTDPEEYGTSTQDYLIYNISHQSGPTPVFSSVDDRKTLSMQFLLNVLEN